MEKKNGMSGLLIILVFAIVCFLVYYVVIYKKNNTVTDRIVIDDTLKEKVKSTVEEYLDKIFIEHSANYCDELVYDDEYKVNEDTIMVYYRMKNYNSLEDIKKSFSSIVSEKFFDEKLVVKYVESDGNVYCGLIPRDSLNYKVGNVTLTSIEEDNGTLSVKGYYKTEETDMDPSDSFNFEVSMVRDNKIWVIDSYEER